MVRSLVFILGNMGDKELKEFIDGLNESVKFTSKADLILSIKKTRDCEPRVVKLERVFKYGKLKFKKAD